MNNSSLSFTIVPPCKQGVSSKESTARECKDQKSPQSTYRQPHFRNPVQTPNEPSNLVTVGSIGKGVYNTINSTIDLLPNSIVPVPTIGKPELMHSQESIQSSLQKSKSARKKYNSMQPPHKSRYLLEIKQKIAELEAINEEEKIKRELLCKSTLLKEKQRNKSKDEMNVIGVLNQELNDSQFNKVENQNEGSRLKNSTSQLRRIFVPSESQSQRSPSAQSLKQQAKSLVSQISTKRVQTAETQKQQIKGNIHHSSNAQQQHQMSFPSINMTTVDRLPDFPNLEIEKVQITNRSVAADDKYEEWRLHKMMKLQLMQSASQNELLMKANRKLMRENKKMQQQTMTRPISEQFILNLNKVTQNSRSPNLRSAMQESSRGETSISPSVSQKQSTRQLNNTRKLSRTKSTQSLQNFNRLAQQESQCREEVYDKYLLFRTLKLLHKRVMQQILLRDLFIRVTSNKIVYYKSLCFLTLKRNLLLRRQQNARKMAKEAKILGVVFSQLRKYTLISQNQSKFEDKLTQKRLADCFKALKMWKQKKIKQHQKIKLAEEYRHYKLKQISLKAFFLLNDCYGRDKSGNINKKVYIPADSKIAELLGDASQFRNQRVELAFIQQLKTQVKKHQKLSIAHGFYNDSLLSNVIYHWRKLANQQKLDKYELVKSLRENKTYTLIVKAFSSLLFNRNELQNLKLQKRKYRFFLMNKTFRGWLKFTTRRQSNQVKLNFFKRRWRILFKTQVISAWKTHTEKWRRLYKLYSVVNQFDSMLQRRSYFLAWFDLHKNKVQRTKGMLFKYFRRFKKYCIAKRQLNCLRMHRVESLITTRHVKLARSILKHLGKLVSLQKRKQYFVQRLKVQRASVYFRKMRNLYIRIIVSQMRSQNGLLTHNLANSEDRLQELSEFVKRFEDLQVRNRQDTTLIQQLQSSNNSLQRQLDQVMKQLSEVTNESSQKSEFLVQAEDKLKLLQAKLNGIQPKLRTAKLDQEFLNDKLYEEKKANIKLTKAVQQLKMINHQNEYVIKEIKESYTQLKKKQNKDEDDSNSMSDINQKKIQEQAKFIEQLLKEKAELNNANLELKDQVNLAELKSQQLHMKLERNKMANRILKLTEEEDTSTNAVVFNSLVSLIPTRSSARNNKESLECNLLDQYPSFKAQQKQTGELTILPAVQQSPFIDQLQIATNIVRENEAVKQNERWTEKSSNIPVKEKDLNNRLRALPTSVSKSNERKDQGGAKSGSPSRQGVLPSQLREISKQDHLQVVSDDNTVVRDRKVPPLQSVPHSRLSVPDLGQSEEERNSLSYNKALKWKNIGNGLKSDSQNTLQDQVSFNKTKPKIVEQLQFNRINTSPREELSHTHKQNQHMASKVNGAKFRERRNGSHMLVEPVNQGSSVNETIHMNNLQLQLTQGKSNNDDTVHHISGIDGISIYTPNILGLGESSGGFDLQDNTQGKRLNTVLKVVSESHSIPSESNFLKSVQMNTQEMTERLRLLQLRAEDESFISQQRGSYDYIPSNETALLNANYRNVSNREAQTASAGLSMRSGGIQEYYHHNSQNTKLEGGGLNTDCMVLGKQSTKSVIERVFQ